MRSLVLLQLAVGLLTAGNAVASPCKPLSSSATSAASLATSTTSTETSSATSSAIADTLTETSAASTTEISMSSTTIETSATTATPDLSTVDSTTVVPTTSEPATTTYASTTETTSTAPMPTGSLTVTGGGPVQGQSLESSNMDGALTAFQVNYPGYDAHSYTIDAQGRLVNDQGWFLCGRYEATNDEINRPAIVVTCSSQIPLQTPFLYCRVSGGQEVQCSIPAISCVAGSDFFSLPTCTAAAGTWDQFSLGQSGPGNVLQIGGSEGSAPYPRIVLSVQ
ncbi:hypothetical protein F53441_8117 [Fusarium austroafricanum]|uniref:Uncharacterized protein n=1 Tax=Fusarium austroafricanum TaxID=2364996 RepID=A0A8H4KC22_9HYPO|nr:hypothetical protein F53441_8117 [Fusarium austroafricanum]